MTNRQKKLGVTKEGYKQGIKDNEFFANMEAFVAKAATLHKGQYLGIKIMKMWIPQYTNYKNCLRLKLEEAKPFFFGLTARFPNNFNYTDTNGLDCLTVK